MEKNNYILSCIFIIVLLLVKEDMSLFVLGFGIYLLIFKKIKIISFLLIILSITYLFISTEYIIPYFRGAPYSHIDRFQFLGDDIGSVTKELASHPLRSVISATNTYKLTHLLYYLFPVIFIPLLSGSFIIILPYLFIQYISNMGGFVLFKLHYLSPSVVLLYYSIICFLKNKKQITVRIIVILVFICSTLSFIFCMISPLREKPLQARDNQNAANNAISLVPPDSSVAAINSFAAHLSSRRNIEVYQHRVALRLEPEYILVDLSDPRWTYEEYRKGDFYRSLYADLELGNYGVLFFQDDILLLKYNHLSRLDETIKETLLDYIEGRRP